MACAEQVGSGSFTVWRDVALALVLLAATGFGCGRTDLGYVGGQVVAGGSPRGFQSPENMRVTFSIEETGLPRSYIACVKADGSFSVDMNDGSGRGIPGGTYVVAIDTNGLLMRATGAGRAPIQDEGNEYPQPDPRMIRKLKNASCTVEVTPRKRIFLTVDLDAGTISEAAAP